MKIEDEGAERRTPVAHGDAPLRAGGAAAATTALSTAQKTAIHVVSVVACYSALYVLFFAPVLFADRLLGAGDGIIYYLINFLVGAAFWDPRVMGGFPVAADPQAMTWYPISVLFSVLGSWNGFVLSAYVLASSFTYGYVFALTRSRLAAAVSGTIYGMSGFMMSHLGHTTIIHAAAWLPLIIWTVENLLSHGRRCWLVVGTLAVACSVLSGHPQISLYSLGVGTLYVFVRCWHAPLGRVRACGLYAAMAVLGLGIASLQVIPTAELAQLSLRREMSFAIFVSYSLPLLQSLGLVFPHLFGTYTPGSDVYTIPYFGAPNLTELTGYVGLLTLTLGVVGGLAKVQRKLAFFWVAVSLVAFSLALGDLTPLAKAMYHLPGLNKFTVLPRHFLEFTMALSVLAGLGAAAIKNQVTTGRLLTAATAGLGGTVLVGLGTILWHADWLRHIASAKGIPDLSLSPSSNPAVGIPLLLFAVGTLVFFGWARRPSSAVRQLLLVAWLVVDLGSFGWFSYWRPLSPHRDYIHPPDLAQRYRVALDATGQRVAPVRGALGSREEIPPNLNRLWGVSSLSGYGPLLLSRLSEALAMLPDGEITGPWYKSENRALDILTVSHVIVSSDELGRRTVADGQDISWSRPGLPVTLGRGCGATQDSLQLRLPVPVKTTTLRVVSALACATAIPDDAEIMSLLTTDSHGRTHSHEFRAGRDTSEWAFDCADVLPKMRHRKAAVALSYPVDRRGGASCKGHRYASTLGFAHEVDVIALRLTWTGPLAAIAIQEVTLDNAKSESLPPAPDLEGYLSASERWHLTEEPKDARVYKNNRAMPRAWLVPETVTLQPDQVLAALKWSRLPDGRSFDPARIGLVEEPLELQGGGDATAEAVVQRITDTTVEVQTRSSNVSLLVLSDIFYPGWSVSVDGAPARLYQTNYVLRGVVVPAGEHLVRFKFTPRMFYAGLGITGLCAAVTIGIAIFGIPRRRRQTDGSQERAHALEP